MTVVSERVLELEHDRELAELVQAVELERYGRACAAVDCLDPGARTARPYPVLIGGELVTFYACARCAAVYRLELRSVKT